MRAKQSKDKSNEKLVQKEWKGNKTWYLIILYDMKNEICYSGCVVVWGFIFLKRKTKVRFTFYYCC